MKVVIRADASAAVGSGHVMRCLSLADALSARGDSVSFVSRGMPAHLAQWIAEHGHRLVAMPENALDERSDADHTRATAAGCDWLVVDHYDLGVNWERSVRDSTARMLAIDDLGRAHECNLLVDQNLGPEPDNRYADRVPPHCTRLLGPSHALLRAEFAEMHARMRAREGSVRRLLVFLGGMDAGNATERVLDVVAAACPADVAVDVVVGASHPALQRIQSRVSALPAGRCHVQVANMVELLAAADLAVGAGGTATWERCALGVPTLAVCIADNQRELLAHASRAGVVYVPDAADQLDARMLATHLRALLGNAALRQQMSSRGLELVDGQGAQRVADAMHGLDIVMRRAVAADCDQLHSWRNHPAVRAVSRSQAEIKLDDHRRWFDRVLASGTHELLIGESASEPVGVVRFDLDHDTAEVSIYLVPQAVGRGRGRALLSSAEAWLKHVHPEISTLRAHVQANNPRSHRLFEACGYVRQAADYTKKG
jgi:UDP-2,4-diacetamido-2,4,6-trideoxy-beta-L-altropyranose hydrolase